MKVKVTLFLWSMPTWAVQDWVLQHKKVFAAQFVLLLEPTSTMPTS